jgi:hypothetical protein
MARSPIVSVVLLSLFAEPHTSYGGRPTPYKGGNDKLVGALLEVKLDDGTVRHIIRNPCSLSDMGRITPAARKRYENKYQPIGGELFSFLDDERRTASNLRHLDASIPYRLRELARKRRWNAQNKSYGSTMART